MDLYDSLFDPKLTSFADKVEAMPHRTVMHDTVHSPIRREDPRGDSTSAPRKKSRREGTDAPSIDAGENGSMTDLREAEAAAEHEDRERIAAIAAVSKCVYEGTRALGHGSTARSSHSNDI